MSIFTILSQPVAILVTDFSKLIKVTNDHIISDNVLKNIHYDQ